MRAESSAVRLLLGALALVACSDATSPGPSLEPPRDLGDGWTVATPASVDLDPGALTTLIDRVEKGSYGVIHAIVIVRHDRLVLEQPMTGRPATTWTVTSRDSASSTSRAASGTVSG